MKIHKLLLSALLSILLISCSKDSDSSDKDGTPVIDKSANLKALGASAHELLSDEKFTSITLEVVYVTGYKPTDLALNNLVKFISDRTFKPDGVFVTTRAVTSSSKAPFSIEEIAEIEAKERSVYNAGDEISVFLYVADGSNEKDENEKVILGSAFRNTSIVLYGKTIEKLAGNFNNVNQSTIESAVLNHEFGHLFGLVDVGTPMLVDHEDPNSQGHCTVNRCLMNANIRFGGSLIDMIDSNKVPELEDLCINDLIANGGR